MKIAVGILAVALGGGAALAAAPLDFAKDVLPILERSCLPCHNATKSEADLMLETPQLMLKGGEKGPAISPNHAADSLLYLTAAKQKKPFMPPTENKSKAPPLSSQQLEILRRWIDEGAIGKGKAKEPVKWQAMPPVARISAVALTADGKLAAASRGNQVTLYDVGLKQPVIALPADAHRDVINALAFNPDGSLLATGSFGEVKLWKLSLLQVRPLSDQIQIPATLECLSPDGLLKASAPANAEARILSADGKKTVASLRVEKELADVIAKADLELQGMTFELAYQKEEQQKADDILKKAEESSRKATTENADFIKRKAEIEKAVATASKRRDDLLAVREKADAAMQTATMAKEAADAEQTRSTEAVRAADKGKDHALPAEKPAAEKAFNDAQAASNKARQAVGDAGKAVAEATAKQKEAVTKANDAEKALSEAKSEIGKAADAAVAASKTTAELTKSKADAASTKKLVEAAQATLDQAKKAKEETQRHLPLVPSPFRGLVFSADSSLVFSTHEDGCLRCWNSKSGEGVWTQHLDKQPLGGLALKDGMLMVAKSSGETVSFDLKPHFDLVRTMGDSSRVDSLLTDRVNALTFSPDGKILATGSGDPSRSGEIKLWDVATGKLARELTKPHKDAVLALDFSSDGKLLASGAADRAVRLWDVATGKLVRNMEAHSGHVLSVSLRHDGRMLASAGADNAVRTWSLLSGDVVKTMSDFKKEVTSIHYTEQRNLLMTTSGDPQVRTFTDEGKGGRTDDKLTKSFLTSGCITASGDTALVGDAAGTLWVLSNDGKVLASFPAH